MEEERKQRQLLEAERDEDSDEDLKGLDERLKKANIQKESKLIIHDKLTKLGDNLTKTMDDRQKQLDEKVSLATGQKKK